MLAGGLFTATAQQGDNAISPLVTESLQSPRTAVAHLQLEHAGKWTVTITHTSSSEATEAVCTVLASHEVTVEEGEASAACSRLTGFWPPQGAVAGVQAGFIIQVGMCICHSQSVTCSPSWM